MISKDSEIIKRHKNPFGIFVRIFIYPLIAYGVWTHNACIIIIGCVMEIFNWRFMPPVEYTYSFIQDIVTIELNWLNACNSVLKTVSIILLIVFVIFTVIGLWFHLIQLIVGGFVSLIAFNVLMNKIGKI